MRPGDLVKLCSNSYPQYSGSLGMLVSEDKVGQWIVVISGKMHPYFVHTASLEVVK